MSVFGVGGEGGILICVFVCVKEEGGWMRVCAGEEVGREGCVNVFV